jgi:prepilin peptidase CpaA
MFHLTQLPLQTQVLAIASLGCLIAAVEDLRTGHIPNWLTLGLLSVGGVTQVWLSHLAYPKLNALLFVGSAVIGFVFSGLVPFLLWKKNALGGGDLKLFAALGALLGPLLGMQLQLYAFLIALVLAPAKLAYEGKLIATIKNAGTLVVNPLRRKERRIALAPATLSEYRFGPAIFLAAVVTTFMTF